MKHILQALIEGKEIELVGGRTQTLNTEEVLRHLANGNANFLRIKPATIRIGDVEIVAPLRQEPEKGTEIFRVFIDVTSASWIGVPKQQEQFANGLIHSTEADAQAHAEALRRLTR